MIWLEGRHGWLHLTVTSAGPGALGVRQNERHTLLTFAYRDSGVSWKDYSSSRCHTPSPDW